MQCTQAEEFFSDYVEKTLDRPMMVALEAHLVSCGRCRHDIDALQSTFAELDALPMVEPPADGAWQVMSRLRAVRAEQYEAERSRSYGLLDWIRSLSPARSAMAAGLATLIIGAPLAGPMLVKHVQLSFRPHVSGTVQPGAPKLAGAPSVGFTYGLATSGGQQVTFHVRPAADLKNVKAQISGASLATPWSGTAGLLSASGSPITLDLPANVPVHRLVLALTPETGPAYRYTVAVPVPAHGPHRVTLSLVDQPVEECAAQLAGFLGRPVVLDDDVSGSATLQVADQEAVRCAQALAEQVGAEVRNEDGVVRLVRAR